MHYLRLIITLPLAAFAVLFALSNRGEITLFLWPLEEPFSLPLAVAVLGFMGAGFFFGALFVSLEAQKTRFRYWQERRRSKRLEKDLEKSRAAADLAQDPRTEPQDAAPAIGR